MLLTAGVVLVDFFLFSMLPADPARAMLGQRADNASMQVINHDFALDQPGYARFLIYLNDLLPVSVYNRKVKESPIYLDPAKYKNAVKMFYMGDDKTVVFKSPYLRRSYHSKEDVYNLLKARFSETGILVIAAIALASLLGVLLGIVSALRRNSWIGKAITLISWLGLSLPTFFIAIFFAWLLGFVLREYTGLNMTGGLFSIDPFQGEYVNWKNLILPAFVLSLRPMAFIIQRSRRLFLDVMSRPYILTAKAKGVRRSMLIINHAWLNTSAPMILDSGRWLGSLLAGTVFVEFVFGWNGIGKLTANAIDQADMPVLMGAVLFIAVFYILLKTFSEILYSTLDPRIDMKQSL